MYLDFFPPFIWIIFHIYVHIVQVAHSSLFFAKGFLIHEYLYTDIVSFCALLVSPVFSFLPITHSEAHELLEDLIH